MFTKRLTLMIWFFKTQIFSLGECATCFISKFWSTFWFWKYVFKNLIFFPLGPIFEKIKILTLFENILWGHMTHVSYPIYKVLFGSAIIFLKFKFFCLWGLFFEKNFFCLFWKISFGSIWNMFYIQFLKHFLILKYFFKNFNFF